jgi:8-oxo-dGTP diphosphatase
VVEMGGRVVVGVALVDWAGRVPCVLLGRRAAPPELAGCWEFPGGKVEAGESEQEGLRRECREELGVEVVLGDRLGPDLALPAGAVLRVWTGRAAGEPVPLAHSKLRWVSAAEMEGLAWLPADRPLVADLRRLLARRAAGPV